MVMSVEKWQHILVMQMQRETHAVELEGPRSKVE